ncbi:DUF58 domain-containing protein [Actinokineospora bangkokensis]|uniref:DUF58 domain-containing protein n=1 Tax=Actinokineospora bangkokensis TaxID=1193682 RepID=A0A1Q9LDC9_9PSEU|nr:DUF58 domain-containing protein [Actinokineospora bangkokensis]OLR90016.1 hypothetical protein BJP25_03280 [Actinokineospora bangkokensis]
MNRVLAWTTARRAAATAGWRGTDALFRGALGGLALVGLGTAVHRLELVVIGLPLLLSTVLAVLTPPRRAVRVGVRGLPRAVEAGDSARVVVEVDHDAEFTALRLPHPGSRGVGPVHLLPGSVRAVTARLRWNAWGEGVDLRPDHLAAGPDALLIHGPVVGRESRRVVLPPVEPLPGGPLPPRLAVGAHRSPRPGDGTEPRAVRPFRPGDRVRRVDWRVSLRAGAATGELVRPHVRERHAEADAELVLALDTRTDVGADLADWALGPPPGTPTGLAPTSLDTAVRAVVSLAAAQLRLGDRVGLVDLGRPQLGLAPGTGRRQLQRLRHQLVACTRSAGWSARPVLHRSQVPAGAAVVVLSPFLDDAVVDVVLRAAAGARLLLAVDVLPHPLTADDETEWGEAALGVLRAEHTARLAALRSGGVPVVTPAGVAAVLARRRGRGR